MIAIRQTPQKQLLGWHYAGPGPQGIVVVPPGIGPGGIAGIVLGALVAVAIVLGLIGFGYRRREERKVMSTESFSGASFSDYVSAGD